jgi:phage pi2 protein 07
MLKKTLEFLFPPPNCISAFEQTQNGVRGWRAKPRYMSRLQAGKKAIYYPEKKDDRSGMNTQNLNSFGYYRNL